MANRYVAAASGLPFAVLRGYSGTDLPEHTRHDQADHLPVHRRAADRRAGARPRRRRHPRPARRPRRQRAAVGASPACRRRRCSAPRRALVTVEEIVDELEPRARRGRAAALGRRRASPRCPAAPSRPTRRTTTTATTTPTATWDAISRDRERVRRWLETLRDERRDHRRRDDERRRRAGAARRHRVLRRHRPAAHGAPTSPAARTRPTSCWSTSRARSAPSRRGCRCRSATAMLAETADAVVSVPEMFNYWLQPGRIDVGFLGARADRPLRQHQHDRDRRRLRRSEGPAARRRRRAGDRRVVRRGDRDRAPERRARSSSRSTSSPPSATATAPATASGSACAAAGPTG